MTTKTDSEYSLFLLIYSSTLKFDFVQTGIWNPHPFKADVYTSKYRLNEFDDKKA